MIVTKVYTQHGDLLREYPDAYSLGSDGCYHVWDTDLADDLCEKDQHGNRLVKRDKNINTGNWIACITGPAIIIEEHQDADREGVRGRESDRRIP